MREGETTASCTNRNETGHLTNQTSIPAKHLVMTTGDASPLSVSYLIRITGP